MNVYACKVFVMGWECWTEDVSECRGSQSVCCVCDRVQSCAWVEGWGFLELRY